MGRVKIKHSRSREAITKRVLLDIIAPTVKVTRLIPTRDAIIVLTGSDKDSDGIFKEGVAEKLRAANFEAIMPPELRCQRTVICFQLDDFVTCNDPAAIKHEIARCQDWAKVEGIYKFPRTNTLKVTFSTSEMAEKAYDQGLLMFNFSVPQSQMRREVYIHLMACDRCHAIEDHPTSECPLPPTYKACSECGGQDHTFRECQAETKQCFNCRQEHSARAMRCPARKKALKEKEERLRKGNPTSTTSFAKTTAQQPPPTPFCDPALQLKSHMCMLHAHYINSTSPGTFQSTLSECLRLNGLPDVKLPPNPPSRAILKVLEEGSTTQQENHREPPPPPEAPAPPPTPPPAPLQEAPPTPVTVTPTDKNEHEDEENALLDVFLVKST